MRIGPAADARAEVYWLAGRPFDEIVEPTRDSLGLARKRGDTRYGGALAGWMQTMGDDIAGEDLESPYDLEVAGRFGEAADRWDALGVPYEAALATWRTGDEASALERLDALGAIGTIDRLRSDR